MASPSRLRPLFFALLILWTTPGWPGRKSRPRSGWSGSKRASPRPEAATEVLSSYDDASLEGADRRSKEIALSLLDLVPEAERFRFHTYPVNQMFGPHSRFPTFMKDTHQVHDRGDAEDYVARLSKVGVKFDQVLEGLRHREQLGILPPQFVVDQLRQKAKDEIGERFDLREFHRLLLTNGSMPLPLMERLVDEMIESGTANAADAG